MKHIFLAALAAIATNAAKAEGFMDVQQCRLAVVRIIHAVDGEPERAVGLMAKVKPRRQAGTIDVTCDGNARFEGEPAVSVSAGAFAEGRSPRREWLEDMSKALSALSGADETLVFDAILSTCMESLRATKPAGDEGLWRKTGLVLSCAVGKDRTLVLGSVSMKP